MIETTVQMETTQQTDAFLEIQEMLQEVADGKSSDAFIEFLRYFVKVWDDGEDTE